ncbi:MAG TPA: DUF1559 domain-containing protein [Candidatus Hydrogenedentes bacterium]|nr:DUF1559 domain-containing protein [Candidatus Hydrogenedentota bacterium]
MADTSTECTRIKPMLQAYALGTLRPAMMQDIARHLEACAACRAALKEERSALSVLDALPEAAVPERLAARTLERIQAVEKERAMPQVKASKVRPYLLELFTACCVLLLAVAIILPAFSRARESARRSSCQNNLKEMGLVFKMYANEHPGEIFPALVDVDGTWVTDLHDIYPEYLSDPYVLLCPTNPKTDKGHYWEVLEKKPLDWDALHKIIAQQYVYVGWAIHNKADLDALFRAPQRIPGEDLVVDGHTVYWLREGVERFLVEDINDPAEAAQVQSELIVMFDNPAAHAHVPHGVNVLYIDGHVCFIRLKEEVNTLREALEAILSLE